MIVVFLSAGFALAGFYLVGRTIVRRASTRERRRLASLGVVEAHREVRPRAGDHQ